MDTHAGAAGPVEAAELEYGGWSEIVDGLESEWNLRETETPEPAED